MAAEYELTLNDYLQIARRRSLHFVVAFLLLLGISIVFAIVIPPVYQSTGTILIESQQIPTDLVKATVTSFAGERIEIIRQRVMTRENLLRVIDKFNLFADERHTTSGSELVDEMRQAINVELVGADVRGGGRGEGTIAFKLSFENRHAETAHKVANELVTLFLDENVKSRTERASETTAFLGQEADRLKAELEKIENQVAVYKQQNANALPEHMEMRMGMIQRIESEVSDLERDAKDTQERLKYLDIELASAKAGFGVKGGVAPAPTPASELEHLQGEYAKLSATYTETHPDVRALKRKIDSLQKALAAKPQPSATEKEIPVVNTATDLMVAKVQAQIDAANARLTSIDKQRKTLQSRHAQLQSEVMRSPQVAHGLETLLRDYETAKSRYDELTTKRGSAKTAQNLEQENKAERFSLLEAPQLPDKPIKPNRKKMMAMGFFLALGGSLGLIMGLESLNQRVRGMEALAALVGRRPLAVIPYITIQSELNRQKHLNKYLIGSVLFVILVSMAVVHFLWMPLDILMYKIISRFA